MAHSRWLDIKHYEVYKIVASKRAPSLCRGRSIGPTTHQPKTSQARKNPSCNWVGASPCGCPQTASNQVSGHPQGDAPTHWFHFSFSPQSRIRSLRLKCITADLSAPSHQFPKGRKAIIYLSLFLPLNYAILISNKSSSAIIALIRLSNGTGISYQDSFT